MEDFESIVLGMTSRNIKERIDSVKKLGDLGDPRGVEYLINNLPELHSELRVNIIKALGKIKDARASGPLIVVYDQTPSTMIRREIIDALLKIRDEHSLSKLMEIVENTQEDLYLRITILKEVRKFGLKDSNHVINSSVKLLKDPDTEIRKNALFLIIDYGIKNIENYILPLIKEDDIEIRTRAMTYLYSIGGEDIIDKVISILSSKNVDNSTKEKIVEVIGYIKNNKIKDLLRKLVVCNVPDIRQKAVFSLSNYNEPDIVAQIADKLSDPSPDVKKAALIALSKMGARSYLKKIIPMVMDRDQKIRDDAVEVIANLSREGELRQMEPLLQNPNEHVVNAVLKVFSRKNFIPGDFHTKVYSLLEFDSNEIRRSLVDLLSVNKDKKSFDYLISIYNKVDEDLKIEILYNLKDYTSLMGELIPVVFEYYKNEQSPKIRAIITDIIALGNDEESGNILMYIVNNEKDKRTKSNAVEALENYLDVLDEVELVNTIMPALSDENNRVKANAAKALWQLGGLRMVAMLEDMLDAQEKWERASACFVLGEIGAIQVVPVLKKALEDPEDVVRGNAIKALAKCGESVLISEFVGEYSKETEVVRQAIVFSVRFFEGELFRNFIMEHLKDVNDDISREAAYSFNHMVGSQPQLLSQL